MRDDHDPLTGAIIGAAIYVHDNLGPGLLESAYEECMAWVLTRRGVAVRRQCMVPIVFEGHTIRAAYRIDLLVDNRVVVEVKTVDTILPVHEAQVRTYLKMSEIPVALLLNFRVPMMKHGIRRVTL